MSDNPIPATPSTGNLITSILKNPEDAAGVIATRKKAVSAGLQFLLAAILFHAIFGLALGFFGGRAVILMDVVKVPLIALCSLALCYPSLYVFACVGGAPLSFSQTFALGASCLAMIGLLLVGLAPVMWLFSVSTESTGFIILLTLFIWAVAAGFAIRYICKLQNHLLFAKAGGIKTWFVILIIVTLQMTTCMRPLLAPPAEETGWWTSQKMFFLQHYINADQNK